MDLNHIRSLVTLLSLGLFLGLMAWTWWPARRAGHDSAALLPFGADAPWQSGADAPWQSGADAPVPPSAPAPLPSGGQAPPPLRQPALPAPAEVTR